YTRSTGKIAMVLGQNGPGITNFVTAIKTAYWNHTPMLLVTPQAANRTIGQGGFQEVEQMALFRDMVCYQEEVRDPARVAEVLDRVISKAKRLSAPAQVNIPRDFWTQVIDISLPTSVEFERPAGGAGAVAEAAKLLSTAKFPVILSGAGVILGNAIPECIALAEKLDAPVCNNYQHNDSFPGSHRLAVDPLGYNGSKAAMELIGRADVVLALGTRLNPFSTLPGYGLDYWPKNAKVIQVEVNPDRIGLTKPVTVGICGDAKLVAKDLLAQLSPTAGNAGREERKALIHTIKSRWLQALSSMDHEEDDPGTTWNADARKREPDRMSARQAWRAIQAGLPTDAVISSDIGNNCAIGNAYPTFETGRKYLAPGLFGPCGYGFPAIIGAKVGNTNTPCVGFAGDGAFGISMNEMSSIGRKEWPGITMVIFRNYQWGAEKRNSILWFDNNFVGTELNSHLSYAKVAEACGLKGVTARTPAELTEALRQSCEAQKKGVTTFIEVILNQELGEPFRRDAMKKPTVVAGIRARARGCLTGFEMTAAVKPTADPEAVAVVDELVRRARAAMVVFAGADQARVDEAVTALAWSLYNPAHAKELAELAVADTGPGNVPDKILKKERKEFCTLRDLLRVKTVGIVEEDKARGIVKYAKPVGVVCAITPSTNPGATPVNKAMMALKGRNAIVIAASPAGLKTTQRTVDYMRVELKKVGLPEDLVQILPPPASKDMTQALMEAADLVVATGSQDNVRRAYSSGTPAIGVGIGNASVIIDETADLDEAAQKICASKIFDNATSCSSENSVVIVDAVYDRATAALERAGGYMASPTEKERIQRNLWQGGKLNRHLL